MSMREGLLLGISHILTNAPYFVLAYMMFRQHRRYSVKATVAALGAFVLAHGASSFLLTVFYHGETQWSHIQFAVFCVGLITILLVLFRISFAKALYAFLLIRAMYTAILYTVLNAFMLTSPGVYIGFDQTPLFTLAAVLANCAVFPFMWKFVTGRLSIALTELDEKTIRQLCIPPALFFLLDQCYSSIRSTLEYESFQTAMIFLLMLATGLATYYVNLRMVMESRERAHRESETEKQLALQAQRYRQLAETIESTHAARHDLRHHLSVITAYVKKDDKPGLEKYLAEYTGSIPDEPLTPYCENLAVDAVAQYYLGAAKAAGTQIDVRLQIPQVTGLPDSELCIIFGNTFENAMTSCLHQNSGRRFIRARCEVTGSRLVFTLDNSGSESNPSGGEDEKGKRGQHKGGGVGLRSVQAVIDKYNGTLEFAHEDGIYKTSIFLMIPDL